MPRNLLPILLLLILGNSLFAKNYRLYFLGGQSNMNGFGYNKDLPADLQGPMEDVMIFHGNDAADGEAEADGRGIWSPLQPGHGVKFRSDGEKNNYSQRFGLELTFARELKAQYPDEAFAFIKYARSGSSIDSLAASRFGCWEPDFQGETGINQWDHFLATMRYALEIEDIDGDGEADQLIACGILWMQGEGDGSFDTEIASHYEDHLNRIMGLIREQMGDSETPVVIGKISDSGRHKRGKVWQYGELIMLAQEEFVRKDPHAAIVRSTKNYAYSDPWHYDSEGYLDLGKQFALALQTIQ